MNPEQFEKLGVFYMGRGYDLAAGKPTDDLLLYESRDLVTHAVCVGMTGSGKTGLCLSLLEEAAIDGIPVLAIDPKGDLTNLLLSFPDLLPEDFAPWINDDDARRAGVSPKDFARQQAEMWKKGLADWGQDGERIRKMRDAAEFVIYTPGATAGRPISVLKSFEAPEESLIDDKDGFRERINTSVSSLLALLGITGDPLQSKEHILLATIIGNAWKQGQSLSLPVMIQQIQNPPFKTLGVMDLESFYPSKERFGLAMSLNNLLASPGFEAWLEGEPLDPGQLLHTKTGKPRICIFYLAHLSDAERMFFVSLLLNQTLGWMRSQPGTTSLRAILFMDEIFGYFPPTANPPSKKPLLTMLKQARAFGVGVVLATQNPVDLDYKGLGNTGTWFLGRLQTERDKARVLDGLEGASTTPGAFNRKEMDKLLSGLKNRVFLMQNVHDKQPVVFQVRWALSYLRGPLTREQIRKLNPAREAMEASAETSPKEKKAATPLLQAGSRPVLPPEISQKFLPVAAAKPGDASLFYEPRVLGIAKVYYADAKAGIDEARSILLLSALGEGIDRPNWDEATLLELEESDLESDGDEEAKFGGVSGTAARPKSFDAWKKTLTDCIYRNHGLAVFRCLSLGENSRPGEPERDFRVRLHHRAHEERDLRAEELRKKYAPKIATIEERIRKAEQMVERKKDQARSSTLSTVLSMGSTVFGALFGRKTITIGTVSKATTAARGAGRSMKDSREASRAQESVESYQTQLQELEEQLKKDIEEMEARFNPDKEELETLTIKPKKTNISVQWLGIAWAPHWQQADGMLEAAWK